MFRRNVFMPAAESRPIMVARFFSMVAAGTLCNTSLVPPIRNTYLGEWASTSVL